MGIWRGVIAAVLILFSSASYEALGRDFMTGSLPVDLSFSTPLAVAPDEIIVLTGKIDSLRPEIVVLRIDDGLSSGYSSRVNREWTLPPGSFSISLPIKGMMKANGKLLNSSDIRRIIFFAGAGEAKVSLIEFRTEAPASLPHGAIGLSFGASDAALFPGFQRVAPGDPFILRGKPIIVRRPSRDPLVASGLRGLERLHLPLPAGSYTLTLWTEDVGEWENLPHPLERRIEANGVTLLKQKWTATEWIVKRYLAGRDREATVTDDAWSLYGRYRGGKLTAIIEVAENGLTIDLAGDSPDATYLSALLVEKADRDEAARSVEMARATWYRSNWPVDHRLDTDDEAIPMLALDEHSTIAPLQLDVAQGTGGLISFRVQAGGMKVIDAVSVEMSEFSGKSVNFRLYAAQKRLERVATGGQLLTLQDTFLRGIAGSLPLDPRHTRRYDLWVDAPSELMSGVYRGTIVFKAGQRTWKIPFDVNVLGIDLPQATKPAGFYLDEAPQALWFDPSQAWRRAQIDCDLALMHSFGLFPLAPALATPFGPSEDHFKHDFRAAAAFSGSTSIFAYAPPKRLVGMIGRDKAIATISSENRALMASGQRPPIWSLADEPSNFDLSETGLRDFIAAFRKIDPAIRLGAQLNNPKDRAYASLFDTVLINPGFGIERETIRQISAEGREVWLYNTGLPRLTAGLWLATTDAAAYVQWHARMPTADPYDPTDGREGDVQMIYPSQEACPAAPDINRRLLQLAEGLVDQRWYHWLAARQDPKSRALLSHIDQKLVSWASASVLSARDLSAIRGEIVDFAKNVTRDDRFEVSR